jgi:hypothetical protein
VVGSLSGGGSLCGGSLSGDSLSGGGSLSSDSLSGGTPKKAFESKRRCCSVYCYHVSQLHTLFPIYPPW